MKNLIEDFPERFHIKAISRALWSGRAAVMVGAGFSRNAEPLRPGVPPMALWKDLIKRIWTELGRDSSGQRYPNFGDDSLRLAEEYKQTFGPAALDNLIEQSNPDDLYQPGEIFVKLLDLPWRDVFTTNYDRLLERTCQKLEVRTYDLVLTEEDLSQKTSPRIVKLHGSFPSHRPYVFTLEDYRKYPKAHAPFVNLIQQSVLENVFLLIGFSGDDPNFLQWAGWVRDHLGPHAPPIFLCGVFDYGSSQRSYLKGIGVTLIDFGPLFPREKYDQGKRHKVSLDWFLDEIYRNKPTESPTWPAILIKETNDTEEPRFPSNGPVSADLLERLLTVWRQQRDIYPGWVLLPEENRKSIEFASAEWIYHETSAEKLTKLIEAISVAQRIDALFEIAWRMQKLMVGLPQWLSKIITSTLESINPKPNDIPIKNHTVSRGDALPAEYLKGRSPWLCWDQLTEHWVELAFHALDSFLQLDKENEFNYWSANLGRVVTTRPDWLARWHSMRSWYFLMNLDLGSLQRELEQWPEQSNLPFWEAKRATFKWIIGERKQAREIAFSAYRCLARAADAERGEYQVRSELGWISLLCWDLSRLMSVEEFSDKALYNTLEEKRRIFYAKLDGLIPHRCDPRKDLARRAEVVSSADRPGSNQSLHLGFDPGQIVENHSIRSGLDASEGILLQTYFEAPTLLILEENSRETLLRNAFLQSPQVVISILILTGNSGNIIDNIFNRHSLFLMKPETIKQIYPWLAQSIRKMWAETCAIGKDIEGISARIIKIGIEILSRLSTRLLPEQREDSFALAQVMFDFLRQSESETNSILIPTVNDFMKRVLYCLSNEQISKHLPWLINKLPEQKKTNVWYRDLNDPFVHVGNRLSSLKNISHQQQELIKDSVSSLLTKLSDPKFQNRESAIVRLGCLGLENVLTSEQKAQFASLIWSKTDSQTMLPVNSGYDSWAFLWLPEPQPGHAKAVARDFLARVVPTSREGKVSSFAVPLGHLESLWSASAFPWRTESDNAWRIRWDDSERAAIWASLLKWWRSEQEGMSAWTKSQGMIGAQCHHLASTAVKILVEVVLQPSKLPNDIAHKEMCDFLSDLEKLDYHTPMSALAKLILGMIDRNNAVSIIRRQIFAHDKIDLDVAMDALVTWLRWGSLDSTPLSVVPIELVDAICFIIDSRHWPSLPHALRGLYELLEICPSVLSSTHLACLANGLDMLANEELSEPSRSPFTRSHIPSAQRPEVIQLTAELAAALSRMPVISPPLYAAVQRWREFGSRADALPELRHPWET